jgi:hypothetical protein
MVEIGVRNYIMRTMVDALIYAAIIVGSALIPISLFLSMSNNNKEEEQVPIIQQPPITDDAGTTNNDNNEEYYNEIYWQDELVET